MGSQVITVTSHLVSDALDTSEKNLWLEQDLLSIAMTNRSKFFSFNSNRKRMSVIVRTPSGKLRLYCKGAVSNEVT